ncbi:hypothetical protein VPH49_21775 [Pseudomonas luteola]|uniref:hypothetical protein n=1 Tax=Pseudomonas luteola TaxID=47886 RepID=UPI003A862B4D
MPITVYSPTKDAEAMANAIGDVFGDPYTCAAMDNARYQYALNFVEGADKLCVWNFWSNGEAGFWVPDVEGPLKVNCAGNFYSNAGMDAADFGAALTLMIVNHAIHAMHSAGLESQMERMIEVQSRLQDLVYHGPLGLDTAEIYSFLD